MTLRTAPLLLAAALVASLTTAPAPARASESRTYEVEFLSASWRVPRKGKSRQYSIEAARYEDTETGEVSVFARSSWMNCDGGSCGGGPEDFEHRIGRRIHFDMSDDMSAARVTFEARGRAYEARLTPVDPLTRPFEFIPGTYERSESCDGESGRGDGFFRRMDGAGSAFGRRFEPDSESRSSVMRYTLTTSCNPSEWWS